MSLQTFLFFSFSFCAQVLVLGGPIQGCCIQQQRGSRQAAQCKTLQSLSDLFINRLEDKLPGSPDRYVVLIQNFKGRSNLDIPQPWMITVAAADIVVGEDLEARKLCMMPKGWQVYPGLTSGVTAAT